MLRRAAALTSLDIATAMTDLRRQMIVVTPQVLPAVQGRMPPLRATPAAAVTGIRYPARGASGSLIIGADGVSLQGEPDLLATVRFDDLAALLRWNDGTQMLVGNDGFQIRLAAGDWNGAIQGGAGRGRGTGWQQVRQAPIRHRCTSSGPSTMCCIRTSAYQVASGVSRVYPRAPWICIAVSITLLSMSAMKFLAIEFSWPLHSPSYLGSRASYRVGMSRTIS